MKLLITITILFLCRTVSFGQNEHNLKSTVDSLRYLKADTLDCRADLFWRIVAKGEAAIPFLINELNDTTPTNISHHCKSTKLNVGEVAYFALKQIAFFPAFVITHIQFDVIDINGCWSFYDYFFNNENKRKYQDLVQQWYDNNKRKFKKQKISKGKQTECQRLFNINNYLVWIE